MKKYFLCVLTGTALVCGAQKRPLVTAASFNPTVLASLDHTFMLGAERQVSPRLIAVLDAGYVFATSHYRLQNLKQTSGFSVRPGLKWPHRRDTKRYFGLQAFYKQVDYRMHDWLGKDCVNGVPTYEELQDFNLRKKSLSINLLAGRHFELGRNLLLDLYLGPGVKWVTRRITEPNSCYEQLEQRGIFEPRAGNATVNLPAGIKLMMRIE